MFCTNCGEQIDDNAVFCPKCGAKVEKAESVNLESDQTTDQNQATDQRRATDQNQATDQRQTINQSQTQQAKPLNRKLVGIIAAVALCLIIVILAAALHKPQIDLNKYTTITFDGYDTIGTATYTFDYEAFDKDWGSRIQKIVKKQIRKNGKNSDELINELIAESTSTYSSVVVDEYFGGKLDKTENLSNGDIVKFKWNCDDEAIEKDFGLKLKYKDFDTTVAGLEEAEVFDPFEGITIRYDGVSPLGTAYIENNGGEDTSIYNYSADKTEGLSNGDKITISLSTYSNEDIKKYSIESIGKIPSETKKEYTVSGLNSYVQSAAEVPEDIFNGMCDQAKDAISAKLSNYMDDDITIKDIQYSGNYFLIPKFPEKAYNIGNEDVLIYKITAQISIPDENYKKDVEYYYAVTFNNIMLTEDGTGSVDYSSYDCDYSSFTYDTGISRRWFGTVTYSLYGYKNINELYGDIVAGQINDFKVENNSGQKDASDAAASQATAGASQAASAEASQASAEGNSAASDSASMGTSEE